MARESALDLMRQYGQKLFSPTLGGAAGMDHV